jgi:hypothetical protein
MKKVFVLFFVYCLVFGALASTLKPKVSGGPEHFCLQRKNICPQHCVPDAYCAYYYVYELIGGRRYHYQACNPCIACQNPRAEFWTFEKCVDRF